MSEREQYENKDISLIDILDTVLDKGVAIKGDLVISIAGIDLVYLDLRVLISAVETLVQSNQQGAKSISSERMDEEKEALEYVTERS
ncbi:MULTISPECIES: gas vesicle protein [Halobacillus]|uniref:Gas vesicle protein GvpS n=2 Tax=Halobacillus TaxID=45667 RepID=I0JQQ2_HALH3|nr:MULTISPECIES: gas vesicle protein [Halobacillus]ASF41523.1 gas vesicle protein [Halobacillus halophilus]MCA1010421.1 gas vesicle protein [Halobacillus halophilus]CCG46472.1 gas vesicle protein GvpS [Halobacillus halophilus DSM 2266]SFF67111.1 Gas vesicle protein [Halobacillus alkaliphilus]